MCGSNTYLVLTKEACKQLDDQIKQTAQDIITKAYEEEYPLIPQHKVIKMFDTNVHTICKWELDGKIERVRIGGKVFITKESLKWVREQYQQKQLTKFE